MPLCPTVCHDTAAYEFEYQFAFHFRFHVGVQVEEQLVLRPPCQAQERETRTQLRCAWRARRQSRGATVMAGAET